MRSHAGQCSIAGSGMRSPWGSTTCSTRDTFRANTCSKIRWSSPGSCAPWAALSDIHSKHRRTCMLAINDPAVIEEILALHAAYEAALVGNDIEKLTAFFWDSEWALRFGVAESLYGASEIEKFRKARPAINLERE